MARVYSQSLGWYDGVGWYEMSLTNPFVTRSRSNPLLNPSDCFLPSLMLAITQVTIISSLDCTINTDSIPGSQRELPKAWVEQWGHLRSPRWLPISLRAANLSSYPSYCSPQGSLSSKHHPNSEPWHLLSRLKLAIPSPLGLLHLTSSFKIIIPY